MLPLKLHWKVQFNDGTELKQFNNNKENLFQDVLDRLNDITLFTLYHTERPFYVSVDTRKGLILVNNESQEYHGDKYNKKNIRLIFFRRHKFRLSRNLVTKKEELFYFIGYQYTTNSNKNKQVFLQINQEGHIAIGG